MAERSYSAAAAVRRGKRGAPPRRSTHVCRKALRLGKFLGNVQDVQTLARCNTASPLPYVAAVGEGVYYFLDQFIWCAPHTPCAPVCSPRAPCARACRVPKASVVRRDMRALRHAGW